MITQELLEKLEQYTDKKHIQEIIEQIDKTTNTKQVTPLIEELQRINNALYQKQGKLTTETLDLQCYINTLRNTYDTPDPIELGNEGYVQ